MTTTVTWLNHPDVVAAEKRLQEARHALVEAHEVEARMREAEMREAEREEHRRALGYYRDPEPRNRFTSEDRQRVTYQRLRAQNRAFDAQVAYDEVASEHCPPESLIAFAMNGNGPAKRRLDAGIKALHPALIGFGPAEAPVHESNFYLRVQVTPDTDLDTLVDAIWKFVETYQPRPPTSNQGHRASTPAHPGRLRLVTPGCSVFLHTALNSSHSGPEAFVETGYTLDTPDQDPTSTLMHREASGYLAEMLELTPSFDFLYLLA